MPRYAIEIPDWRPTLDNELAGRHWARAGRRKKADAEMVAGYALLRGVPRAAGRRRVEYRMTIARGTFPDPLAVYKSLLDALVKAGLLIDDDLAHCEPAVPTRDCFDRGPRRRFIIILEDLPDDGAEGRPPGEGEDPAE